jgi:DNA-binding transcriptional regulator GbsR (MarR family)
MLLRSTHSIEQHFVNGMTRVAHFWGFPKAMGAAYAAIYLSPEPLSLDDIAAAVSVTKGGLVQHLRGLQRLGIVHKESRVGDRKDYYIADTDFWGAVRQIVRERQKPEFARALKAVGECIESLSALPSNAINPDARSFLKGRLLAIKRFFDALDRIAMIVSTADSLGKSAFESLSLVFKQPSHSKEKP